MFKTFDRQFGVFLHSLGPRPWKELVATLKFQHFERSCPEKDSVSIYNGHYWFEFPKGNSHEAVALNFALYLGCRQKLA